jgi:predicted MPP superfamily phosphohydrolase
MLTYDQFPAFVFVALVALVYFAAARYLIIGWNAQLRRGERYFRRIVWVLAVIGIGCFAYGYFVEPYWPEVVRVDLRTAKFNGTAQPVRIVHISDLHCDPKRRLEDRLPTLIAEEKPDLILFSGDATNSDGGVPVFRKVLSDLARIAPTYGVKGNWDAAALRARTIFDETGATELTGHGISIEVRGHKIWLTGLPVGLVGSIPALMKEAPPDAYSIFVYHYPDEIYAVAGKVDLYCAGHTHGGQVALPLYGALITLSRFGKRFESGLYQVNGTQLYVNRGIGMEGNAAPRVRFFARPEITVYEIGS